MSRDLQPEYQTVSELTFQIKNLLNEEYPDVLVRGEVSGLSTPRSGHRYFNLKDDSAQLAAVIWRGRAAAMRYLPEEGDDVICEGYIDVYPARGSYQLIVQAVQPVGQGALQIAFQRLYEKLKQEGLFEPARKRPLPPHPRHVAVMTSPTGAAIHDFLNVVRRRWPALRVTIIPVKVQGEGAAEQIAAALNRIRTMPDCPFDLLVLTRGGGSIEDLWCFNEEIVCRALAACPIPTVTAVGHEIDTTLVDFVADLRALTPTEAGERIVPDWRDLQRHLAQYRQRLVRLLRDRIRSDRTRVDTISRHSILARPLDNIRYLSESVDRISETLAQALPRRTEQLRRELARCSSILNTAFIRLLPNARDRLNRLVRTSAISRPKQIIDQRQRPLQDLAMRLSDRTRHALEQRAHRLETVGARLHAFSPLGVLKRGYSLTLDADGNPVRSWRNVQIGDTITTRVADGRLTSRVESTAPEPEDGQEEKD